MILSEKLQIILITFNRIHKLDYTLKSILNIKSPINNCDILVLDNASTDGSSKLLDEYSQKYPNLIHKRHPNNIGGNANICRAFEIAASCGKEYAWILCDDDKYDFSNWKSVEHLMEDQVDAICVADYVYPNNSCKNDPAYHIFQMSFVPAGIYKTSNITNDILIAMYDSIFTMFQQLALVISLINENKKIFVLDKPIVFNGLHFDDKEDGESLSYVRGISKKSFVLERRQYTSWVIGYVNILSLLNDKKLRMSCLEKAIPYKDIYNTWENFYINLSHLIDNGHFDYFYEVYKALPQIRQKQLKEICISSIMKIIDSGVRENSNNKSKDPISFCFLPFLKEKWIQYRTSNFRKLSFWELVFSLTREREYKVVRILGLKFKIKSISHNDGTNVNSNY